jgi:phosphatidylserine/phosphatidylglycerophosphate/cardiolipin synthase-like enzyme
MTKTVKLLIQPADGVTPLVRGIESAKKSVEIVVFRFDRSEIEHALSQAVNRGVFVRALIAHNNRGGERNLRLLESRLLSAGVTVARTNGNLVRYHDKLVIIDRRTLYLCAFNFTYADIEHSRSFGLITRHRALVQEAVRLFECDVKRQPYTPGLASLVVSPANARKQLAAFIRGARKELLIYDLKISDAEMVRLLQERAKAGVAIRIIGRVTRKSAKLEVRKLHELRLHARAMVRDRHQAFIGSQSLRELELDARREVGIIFRGPEAVNRLISIFEEDWAAAEPEAPEEQEGISAAKAAKKVAKAVTKDLPPVAPVVEQVLKEVAGNPASLDFDSKEIEESVKDAVKEAVQDAVKDVVEEAVEQQDTP